MAQVESGEKYRQVVQGSITNFFIDCW